MRYEVVVTPKAERDIERVFQFLIDKNLDAALRAERLIRDGMASLQDSPLRGRPSEHNSARELVLKFGKRAYILRYRVTETQIVIGGVRHSLEKSGR